MNKLLVLLIFILCLTYVSSLSDIKEAQRTFNEKVNFYTTRINNGIEKMNSVLEYQVNLDEWIKQFQEAKDSKNREKIRELLLNRPKNPIEEEQLLHNEL